MLQYSSQELAVSQATVITDVLEMRNLHSLGGVTRASAQSECQWCVHLGGYSRPVSGPLYCCLIASRPHRAPMPWSTETGEHDAIGSVTRD